MAADPLQYKVDLSAGAAAVVVAPIVSSIPGFNIANPFTEIPPGPNVLEAKYFATPMKVYGTGASTPQQSVIQYKEPATGSELARFRDRLHTGPDPYQLNGRSGTPHPSDYGKFSATHSQSRHRMVRMYLIDASVHLSVLGDAMNGDVEWEANFTNVPGTTPYGETMGLTPQLPAHPTTVRLIFDSVESPIPTASQPGGGGPDSVRPEEGLLYPRRV